MSSLEKVQMNTQALFARALTCFPLKTTVVGLDRSINITRALMQLALRASMDVGTATVCQAGTATDSRTNWLNSIWIGKIGGRQSVETICDFVRSGADIIININN